MRTPFKLTWPRDRWRCLKCHRWVPGSRGCGEPCVYRSGFSVGAVAIRYCCRCADELKIPMK